MTDTEQLKCPDCGDILPLPDANGIYHCETCGTTHCTRSLAVLSFSYGINDLIDTVRKAGVSNHMIMDQILRQLFWRDVLNLGRVKDDLESWILSTLKDLPIKE